MSKPLILLLAVASLCAPSMAEGLGRKRLEPAPSQAVLEARARAAQAKAAPPTGPRCEQAPAGPLAVTFPFDTADLTDPARATIAEAVLWVRCHPGAPVVIRGTADNHRSADYQKALADKRAETVRAQLAQLGTPAAVAGAQVPQGALLIEARGQGW